MGHNTAPATIKYASRQLSTNMGHHNSYRQMWAIMPATGKYGSSRILPANMGHHNSYRQIWVITRSTCKYGSSHTSYQQILVITPATGIYASSCKLPINMGHHTAPATVKYASRQALWLITPAIDNYVLSCHHTGKYESSCQLHENTSHHVSCRQIWVITPATGKYASSCKLPINMGHHSTPATVKYTSRQLSTIMGHHVIIPAIMSHHANYRQIWVITPATGKYGWSHHTIHHHASYR